MKELFYYQDSMMKEFTADVVKTGTDEQGPYVVLSNTAFYPTGGGQPNDTGWINGIEVVNVEKVDEDIRLVIIPDYDYNGCGGTHPTSTGQVQMIKIMEIEKMKSNIRVHFVCGNRVREQLAMRKTVLTDVARQLSVPEKDANVALTKLMTSAKQTEKALAEARDALLGYEAKEYAHAGEAITGRVFENRTIQELQKLARFMTTENANITALLVANNEDMLQFVAARGANVETSMKSVSAAALPIINGKGGGNDALVQGGGEKIVSPETLVDAMREALND